MLQPQQSKPNSSPSSLWTTTGAQSNITQCQQCTDITARLDAIEYRLYALEFLPRRRQEAASSTSSILNILDNHHTSNASLSANASCYGVIEGVVSELRVRPGHQHGQPSLEFAIDTDGHHGVEDITGQQIDHTFDELFDFDLASYAAEADANNRSNTCYEDADANDFGTMSVGTPLDIAIALPATVTTSSNTMSATPMAAIAPVAPPRPRYQCPNCGKMFLRPSDRDRHALKHNPNAPRYPCTYRGCRYSGMNAFLRKDKLREHRARYGH